jgi:hypothetical protein
MADEQIEAKEEVIEKSIDEGQDEFLDNLEKENSSDSSTEKTEGEETETKEAAGSDQDKTDKVKEVEADTSLSVEDKIAKIKEILGDDEKAIDAYIKQKGYHNDPAWQKQREIIDRLKQEKAQGALSVEDKALLADVKKVTSSREYIETSMKAQGYTQDAIDKALRDKGIDVAAKPADDLSLIASKLNIPVDKLSQAQKDDITDIAKIVDVIFKDRLDKILPNQLKPIQEHISSINQETSASKIVNTMKEAVKNEGILDFEKDIEPEINKFIDANPDATQADVLSHFKELNHKLTVERLRTGKKKEERDEKKGNLRQNVSGGGNEVTPPAKTGDFDKDADALLDSLNVT